MPRHVAYILTTLAEPLANVIPWYRVVPEDGKLSGSKRLARMQSLNTEGIELHASGEITHFSERYVSPADLGSGVPKQHRGEASMYAGKR